MRIEKARTSTNLILLSISSLLFMSCLNMAKEDNIKKKEITIPGNDFQNSEAEKLNEEGVQMSKNGDYKSGKAFFLKALEIEPDNPTILSNLGLNNYFTKDYESAKIYYQKAYTLSDSTYHIAAINLGLTYFYNKEFDKGIEICNYVINSTEDKVILCTAYVHRSLNYLGKDECQKAQADLFYIQENFKGIGNSEYHIKDLTEKVNYCIEYRIWQRR